jgi:hypothetical protein
MMVLPGGAEVEVHHVADAIAVEDGVDCVQRDREEGNSEGQTQLKWSEYVLIQLNLTLNRVFNFLP